MTTDAPRTIGVTTGDPAGVGVEVLRAALAVVGDLPDIALYGPDLVVAPLASAFDRCRPVATSAGLEDVVVGRYSAASGRASLLALRAAATDLASGRIGALVTGPISKLAFEDAGLAYPGQTELVAEAVGARRHAMMLAGPVLRVVLATTHCALRDVASLLTADRIFDAGDLAAAFLRDRAGIAAPRLAVVGLNPHASDGGRFGDEEARIVAPAIARLKAAGVDATGPIPADTAFHRAATGAFDAVVAMYHDQGLGPLKLMHFLDAVNITLGLPRLRCSPDHGPAFDIAGTGRADPTSMVAALRLAAGK